MTIPHCSFDAMLGDGVRIGLRAKCCKLEQAVKLIADDVLKMLMEVRIFLQENAKLGVGDNHNAFIILKTQNLAIDLGIPIAIDRASIVVLQDLLPAIDGVNSAMFSSALSWLLMYFSMYS